MLTAVGAGTASNDNFIKRLVHIVGLFLFLKPTYDSGFKTFAGM